MVVDLEEDEEDNDDKDNNDEDDNNNDDDDNDNNFFLLSEAKQKMLSEAKQTPAEQLALLSRASVVQFYSLLFLHERYIFGGYTAVHWCKKS